jgi:hypothetical protein
VAGAVAARAGRETAARAERGAGGGRPGRGPSAFSQPTRRLALEAAVIAALIAAGAALVYHYGVHHVHNPRPLGGANVDVSRSPGEQTQTAIAVSPTDPRLLVEAANDDVVSISHDGGRTWAGSNGPDTRIGACPHRTPRVAVDAAGREYLAFLAGKLCDDDLTSYVVVAERDGPAGRWRLVRVTRPAWSYGYDDGPALAVGGDGTVYVAFERSYSEHRTTTVVSRSDDHGRTWARPVVVSSELVQPHLASVAVRGHDVYVAGIDVQVGVWVARSRDGGRSFSPVRRAARLVQNPASGCAVTGTSPVPREQTRCIGPDPTVVLRGGEVDVVYADGGANGAGDVFVTGLDRALRPRFHVRVNPDDGGHASRQFLPVAAADATTGMLWACWYDTRYGDSGHAWFTCSWSTTGRTWSAPVRAASAASDPSALYGDAARSGLYAGLAASGGVAHPVWIDSRRPRLLEEVFTAALRPQAPAQR